MYNPEYRPSGVQNHPSSYTNPAFQQPPPPPRFDGSEVVYAEPVAVFSCIKCGTGTGVTLEKTRRDYVPWVIYLTALISIFVPIILALFLRVKHELNLPFCSNCSRRYKYGNIISALFSLGLIVFMFGGVAGIFYTNSLWTLVAGIVAGTASVIAGFVIKKKCSPVFKKVGRKEVIITDPVHGDLHFAKG
jgi:hypothetical protein